MPDRHKDGFVAWARWTIEHWDVLHKYDYDEATHRQSRWRCFRESVGPRYADALLSNFAVTSSSQQKVVDAIRAYGENLYDNIVTHARNVVLCGPSGTGKDHLLVALGKHAIERGFQVDWINGPDLFALYRKEMKSKDGDEWLMDCYGRGNRAQYADYPAMKGWSSILIISDPVPARGELSEFNTDCLWRIVDCRYRHRLPVWVTMNVSSGEEAEARLGVAIVDRLRDNAITLSCNWPSYRRAANKQER